VLGTSRDFQSAFADPIERSRDRLATPEERAAGQRVAGKLADLIAPFILRREKSAVLRAAATSTTEADDTASTPADARSMPAGGTVARAPTMTLGEKRELVVWTRLTAEQLARYRSVLASDGVRAALKGMISPLEAVTLLKKICTHLQLVRPGSKGAAALAAGMWADDAAEGGSVGAGGAGSDGASSRASAPAWEGEWSIARLPPPDELLASSGKLQALLPLLRHQIATGHKILVFSQSVRMLDIIWVVLRAQTWMDGFTVSRIDGGVSDAKSRRALVDSFNADPCVRVCLLTTGVGGVGLTLTAADRVIIFDPSWNPAVEQQAVSARGCGWRWPATCCHAPVTSPNLPVCPIPPPGPSLTAAALQVDRAYRIGESAA